MNCLQHKKTWEWTKPIKKKYAENKWLIDCMVFNAVFNSIQLYRSGHIIILSSLLSFQPFSKQAPIDCTIVLCLKPLSTVIQLYCGGQCTYPCFLRVLLPVLHTIFFLSHWLLSHITIVETTDSSERECILSQWISSILGKNIGHARDQTSNLQFWSPQRYQLSYGAWRKKNEVWLKCCYCILALYQMINF